MTLIRTANRTGFTLLELLLVIAIILILIAIAIPNFLGAQIRAKVVKAKSEIRVLATALEVYHSDWGLYPERSSATYRRRGKPIGLTQLLEPHEYLRELPEDPFPLGFDFHTVNRLEVTGPFGYWMTGVDGFPNETLLHPHGGRMLRAYVVFSAGPDAPEIEINPETGCMALNGGSPRRPSYNSYSPTNGIRSRGDIWMFGGENVWMGLADVFREENTCVGRISRLRRPRTRVWGVTYNHQRLYQTFPPGSTL